MKADITSPSTHLTSGRLDHNQRTSRQNQVNNMQVNSYLNASQHRRDAFEHEQREDGLGSESEYELEVNSGEAQGPAKQGVSVWFELTV